MSLRFTGSSQLRQRLVFACLSNKAIRIDKIRADDLNPGLREYEVSFLRLLDTITNGSVMEISYTGTSLYFKPGQIRGGKLEHKCNLARGIGYYLEPLMVLLLWAKEPTTLVLHGVTSSSEFDTSVDIIRTAILPVLLKQLQLDDDLELRILKRGAFPQGGGEVLLHIPIVKSTLCPINFVKHGKVLKIRGISYSTRVPPSTANRLVESARSVLNRFIPDIYIYTDVRHGQESGLSPGWGLSLVAETDSNSLRYAECVGVAGQSAEDAGADCARTLLASVELQGCVADFVLFFNISVAMVLASEDVSHLSISQAIVASEAGISVLRDIYTFFGVKMHLSSDSDSNSLVDQEQQDQEKSQKSKLLYSKDSQSVTMSCKGIGYRNVNRVLKQ